MRVSSIGSPPRLDEPGRRVELDVREPEHLAFLRPEPPKQRAQPGQQLVERERLDDVVVGARVEAGDPVGDLVARGQHQDGQRVAGPAKAPAGLEPVQPRHRDVEDDRVDAVAAQSVERLLAVAGQLDVVALQLEGTAERVPDGGLVVDDENLHTVIVRTDVRGA